MIYLPRLGITGIQHQILIAKDGDQYAALIGSDLQKGICGYVLIVKEALQDLVDSI